MRYIHREEESMQTVQAALNRTGKYYCQKAKKYLKETYCHICAYCESEVEASSYFEVEHFYPKSEDSGIPKSYKTDIHNLHYACKRCNVIKNAKLTPILSPNFYKEKPSDESQRWIGNNNAYKIELHEKLWYVGHLLFTNNDSKANNTISLLHLNNEERDRGSLIESRIRQYCFATFILDILYLKVRELKDYCENTAIDTDYESGKQYLLMELTYYFAQLRIMMNHGAPYSQMIIDNFKIPLYQLLAITNKIISA